ncbi:dihydrofolate reductase family protein [Arthrobacter monumenti]
MSRLIYMIISSLDGYIADESGSFDWAVPDEEVLAFLNHQEESVGTYLYGRRMYELMHVWENDPAAAAQSPESANFARVWQAADKIVYSSTLPEVWTRQTELRREFDADEVRQLKDRATADINIAGPNLAAHAFRVDLVDEIQVMVVPIIIGSGKAYYPRSKVPLVLREHRRFGNGMMWLRYDVA